MLIAFALMGLILVVTPWAYTKLGITPPADQKTAAPKVVRKPGEAGSAAASSASGTPMTNPNPPAADGTAAPAEVITGGSAQDYTLDTDFYNVVFTNRGATVKSWTLKKFRDSAGKPLELVNQKGAEKFGYPFSFTYRDKQPSTDLDRALWVAHPGTNTIAFEFSDGRTHAAKTFTLQQQGYMVQYSDEVTQNGASLPHLVEWRGGFGDMAVQNAAAQQFTIHYDSEKNKLYRDAAKTGKNGPANADGSFSFAGIDDQYFAAAFLPPPNTPIQTTTFQDTAASSVNSSEEPYPGVALGGAGRNQFAIYLGPKEISALHQVNPRL
ncbi:MAG: membrane protein insertase YidC, partial [Acidobacteriota bacterium]|nr:membrane protein insertase YidC [Acidobacteriota bacterium]